MSTSSSKRICSFSERIKNEVESLIRNKQPSEDHKAAWKTFDKYLMVRTITFMTALNFIYFIFEMVCDSRKTLSEKFLDAVEQEGEGVEIVSYAKSICTFSSFVRMILFFIRIMANILAFKWPIICKLTFYVDFFLACFTGSLPINVPLRQEIAYRLVMAYLTFLMAYFNWKTDILLSLLSLIPVFVNRSVFHQEDDNLSLLVLCMLWLGVSLFATHLAVTKIGILLTESVFLRRGND